MKDSLPERPPLPALSPAPSGGEGGRRPGEEATVHGPNARPILGLEASHEPEFRPQGFGVRQPSGVLQGVGVTKHQRTGAVQDAHAPRPGCLWSRVLLRGRKFGKTLLEFSTVLAAWFTPSSPLHRYRVAPRANQAAFRHDLLRGIQLELHRAGFVTSRQVAARSKL